jgi:NhaC family Na+:H+ antiporter
LGKHTVDGISSVMGTIFMMLSRQIKDTATITSPLAPWNTYGAYVAATLGVATIAYLPYCFFDLINPVLSFIFDAVGYQIKTLTAEKAPEAYPPEPEWIDHYGVSGYPSTPPTNA